MATGTGTEMYMLAVDVGSSSVRASAYAYSSAPTTATGPHIPLLEPLCRSQHSVSLSDHGTMDPVCFIGAESLAVV